MSATTTVREHGMLFQERLVRAIAEGRKTETRRPIKGHESWLSDPDCKYTGCDYEGGWGHDFCIRDANSLYLDSPAMRGDRIWVRETFTRDFLGPRNEIVYRASEPTAHCKWTPSIHMPRKYARYILKVLDVRAERIQDITEEGAIAEGIDRVQAHIIEPGSVPPKRVEIPYRDYFQCAWEKIYPGSWDRNDWVWAYKFKRAEESPEFLRQDGPGGSKGEPT